MALEFTSTHREARLHGVKFLVHGQAGVGKTPLCATAPTPLILSAEAGLLSTAHLPDIPVIKIRNFTEMAEAYRFITQSEHARHFETICLDSLTEIAEQCLAAEKGKSKDPRRAYGEMQDTMIQLVKDFRDIPGKHVYFSCKQEWQKDEVTGVMIYGPMMPGQKVGPQLPYLFDEVFSMESAKTPEGVHYSYLRTKRGLQHQARDRSQVLDEFEEPHLGKLIKKILSSIPSNTQQETT